ncbi:GntR family transcriptional regulator [Mangrovibacillus sp. Mu-81]|uniref:GntR family transcriptional regulator n=1 Tax=Mangrovibacillus sp. Mu-81 TaxID=3121478 RepID=UPI002FE4D609
MIKKESLAEQAFNLIKKEIISGKLAPAEELPEKKLAQELGISRTPVREALRRLAVEGLVVLSDQKIATVASFTEEDAMHFMEIRKLLEVYNLEAVSPLKNEVFEKIKENMDAQLKAITAGRYEEFIDLDREFHLLLAGENPNPRLRALIQSVNTGVNRAFLVLSNTLQVSAMEAYGEHKRIVDALEVGMIEEAKREMADHMKNIASRIKGYYLKEVEE